MEETKLSYKLEVFEGPLDLLLSLIAKNEIDIYDIPIAIIFDQYMDYIKKMQKLDMDIASEFIVMASELMLIKSRMLLPKAVVDGVEVDPREDLVRTLIEYQRAKEEAAYLAERYKQFFGRFTKETDEVGIDKTFVADQESAYLLEALDRILKRLRLDETMKNDDAAKTLTHIITQRPSSVSERTGVILKTLRAKRQ
ncbi:MAG: segregation/condensation protein A, partial [Clostridia bacterium]|nr:segregation/condensation protein A [Clostridia bacterium]